MLTISEEFKIEANLIDGKWVGADSGNTFEVTNPATGELIGTAPDCGKAEATRAIEAAEKAFKTFGKTTAKERSEMLHKLHDIILENQEALAHLLSAEQGKPLAESRGEVGMSAAYIRWYAAESRRVYGDVIPSPWKERRILVTREPIGVVSCITPWNFPSSMLARKIGPAIAAGCTVVCKPAEATPYSGLAWGKLAEMAGIPAGVVNILTGNPSEIGEELTTHPAVRKVTFTGSTRVGKIILEQCSRTVKKCSMELGGNAPFLVFDDADVDRAVEGAIAAKYRNSGQTCVCTNRFLVQSGIYDTFVEKLTEATASLKVGQYTEEDVQQGPLINEAAVEKCETFVADAKSHGGEIATGGARHALGGNFFEPTIIANANDNMLFSRDEIFGPVAPIYKFETEEEALE
ncbi:MAG: NAD-dependent succinate-semialdehyde dehydrogenase, partial [Pseudomonadota bacterium]